MIRISALGRGAHIKRIHQPLCLSLSASRNVTANLATTTTATSPPPPPPLTPTEPEAKPFSEVPGPKGLALWPVVGAAFLFKPYTPYPPTRPDLMAKLMHEKYGKIVHIRLPFGHAVLLSDPKDMQVAFHNEGKYPTRPNFGIVDHYFKSRKLKSLSTMNGEEWRSLRMRVQPKFMRPSAADPYVPAIGQVADDLAVCVKNLKPDDDLKDLIFMYVLECLGQFCFSRRIGALTSAGVDKTNEMPQKVKVLFNILGSPPVLPTYKLWKTKAYQIVESSMDYLIGEAKKEVEQAIASLRDSKAKERDNSSPHFMETLLASSDLTEAEVIMSMCEFFFGGTDTTSRMLGLVLYQIARNPDQQQLLYKEIRDVVGTGPVTSKNLAKMEFTKACVKESFRLVFPLALGPPRFMPTDVNISGYNIPKGTLACLSNIAYLHDPDNIENPEDFRPQRWLRGEDRKKNEHIPNVAFLPFGIGARMCIGKRFAEQILHLGLIKLVQQYQLELTCDPKDVNIVYSVFPSTEKELPIRFTQRKV